MSYNPYKIIPAVLVAVIKNDSILLAKRHKTSYMDGWYGLPGGHMEENETLQEGAARELQEETGLNTEVEDFELFHIYQNKNTPGRQYIGFMFRTKRWKGTPASREEKVKDVAFFNLNNLPEKIIPYHREALDHLDEPALKITYTPLGSFDPSGKLIS